MSKLWIYKCNSRNREYQSSYGDWGDFFQDSASGPTQWGDTLGIGGPSRSIIHEKLKPGDKFLCWQTDRRRAIGIARLVRFENIGGHDCALILEAVEQFAVPVPLLELKKTDPALAAVHAFKSGPVSTLSATTSTEAKILLAHCHASVEAQIDQSLGGAGFSSNAEENRKTEQAAVKAVTRTLADDGWVCKSVEARRNLGYDLLATKGRKERHVEVKGTVGLGGGFILTKNELRAAKNDRIWELQHVTYARVDESRIITTYTGAEVVAMKRDAIAYRICTGAVR